MKNRKTPYLDKIQTSRNIRYRDNINFVGFVYYIDPHFDLTFLNRNKTLTRDSRWRKQPLMVRALLR